MLRILLLLAALLAPFTPAAIAADPITLSSLLREMADADAIARFPDPAYTCAQFSSYDRASTTPDDPQTWFANADAGKFLRTEQREGRTEHVMADMAGPGAIVRIWSANPKGTMRIYLDGSDVPQIEAPMEEILGGKWSVEGMTIGEPFAGVRSRGWNLYLPIPYATRCVVTSDRDGFYYQINYRTYEPGTHVWVFRRQAVRDAADVLADVGKRLLAGGIPGARAAGRPVVKRATLAPGESVELRPEAGQRVIRMLSLKLEAPDPAQAARSVVLEGTFDGERTVRCPVGRLMGDLTAPHQTRRWRVAAPGAGTCYWPMPYRESALLRLTNHGQQSVGVQATLAVDGWNWDDRSMHFHAVWRAEHDLPTRPMRDWSFVHVRGRGVLAGDALGVMNPVADWWGEGDEKIFVDGEAFPSHFGTGTEDYYGYAWCSPKPFSHPLHAQPRCDGHEHGNNWGHTSLARLRALDAIPFDESLRFDMEVWHWKACRVAYDAATFFYALPGAAVLSPADDPRALAAAAATPIPQPPPLPPPFRIEGAIECEKMKITDRSEGLAAVVQDMRGFAERTWSGEAHLWVQGRGVGDFIEVEIPVPAPPDDTPRRLILHATKSWDYGIVRPSVNGVALPEIDLSSGAEGRCLPTGPIDLGVHTPDAGRFLLRLEVTGANPAASGSRAFFGLDCVTLGREP